MHLMKLSQLLVLGISGLVAVAGAQAQSAAPVAKVNGVTIPQARLELIMQRRAAQGQPDSPEVRKAVREALISEEVVAQEAVKKGLERDPDVATQIEIARQSVLITAYQNDFVKTHKVGDEDLRKEYEALKALLGDKEFKAQHIMVGTEEEAKDIIARIKKGAKFDKVAAEKSKDASSKDKGGDLGWRHGGNLPKQFTEALAKVKKNSLIDQPVQLQGNWHVLRLDDVRPFKMPSADEIKQDLQQRILQRQLEAAITELRAKAKVE